VGLEGNSQDLVGDGVVHYGFVGFQSASFEPHVLQQGLGHLHVVCRGDARVLGVEVSVVGIDQFVVLRYQVNAFGAKTSLRSRKCAAILPIFDGRALQLNAVKPLVLATRRRASDRGGRFPCFFAGSILPGAVDVVRG